jgi:aromatic-amino-acid transaminase
MPENMLVAIAYSMSKSFLIYGMRSGALVGLSSSKEAAEEFFQINSFSNRAVWSNGTRGAQKLLADVAANPILKAEIDKEREIFSDLLFKRAGIFLKEAEEVGLQTLPYKCGFFITVPAANPQELTEKLMESNIFTVPNLKGVRFAVCAVPTYKISGIAGKTKEALNKLCV